MSKANYNKSAAVQWARLRNVFMEICDHMDKTCLDNDHVISHNLYNQELIWVLDKLYADNVLEAIEIKNEEKENSCTDSN